MRVELRGVVRVKAKGRYYFYAWRGGPRLRGEPGTPEFVASYNEAVADRKAPDTSRFRGVVASYKASDAWKGNAETTKESWGPILDEIADYFGDLSIAQFNRAEKIRPVIGKWHQKYAATPRSADTRLTVLSVVLGHAVEKLFKISVNPCDGMSRLYSVDRSEIIWTDADIAQIKKACRPELVWAIDLAANTGLRSSDLLRLSWNHVHDDAIIITTGKSRHKREAIVPLHDDLRAALAAIPKRSPVILTSSRKRPWSKGGFDKAFWEEKRDAGMLDRDLHFHDLRGTAATRFYVAGLPVRVIAEILGWEEESVEKIIKKYVGRQAATRAWVAQINAAKR